MFLDNLPKEISTPPDWRQYIAENFQWLDNAFRYADAHNLKAVFSERIPGQKAAGIAPYSSIVKYLIDSNSDLPWVLQCTAHEVKHHSQAEIFPVMFSWHKLMQDIDKSIRTRQYCLADTYNLPLPHDAICARIVAETDAMNFGMWSEMSATEASQEMIDEEHAELLADEDNVIKRYINEELDFYGEVIRNSFGTSNEFGRSPNYRWIHLPVSKLQHSTAALWSGPKEFCSPFLGPKGASDISALSRKVAEDPEVAGFTNFITPYMRATPARALKGPERLQQG